MTLSKRESGHGRTDRSSEKLTHCLRRTANKQCLDSKFQRPLIKISYYRHSVGIIYPFKDRGLFFLIEEIQIQSFIQTREYGESTRVDSY